jgi:phosphoribosyl 1,2-cyclic phosphodiesterase
VAKEQANLRVKLWGVRGSIPSPGPLTIGYGGNTACVEIGGAGKVVIVDAGTGIRALGDSLMQRGIHDIDLLFSHCHFDHIEGLPFFGPLYRTGSRITMWSGHLNRAGATSAMVSGLIASPYFPVGPAAFRADITYRDFTNGSLLELAPGLTAKTITLKHPGGATGYRLTFNGSSVCYISDVEHEGTPNGELVEFVRGTELMIYDAMYKGSEYERYRGFGHSTWEEAIRLADAAAVGHLVLFHHFPGRSDQDLDAIEQEAARARPATVMAREGMEFEL